MVTSPKRGAKRQYFGPYRIKQVQGSEQPTYEIVALVDNHSDKWEPLRPRRTCTGEYARQSATRAAKRLNLRWQQEHQRDENILDYWREATH